MIWDLHCHFPGFGGRTPEEAVEDMLRLADRMRIERFLLYMGERFLHDPTEAELREQNDWVLRAVARGRNRVHGLVYLSPAHMRTSLAEFDRCVRDGPMVGVKLWVARRCREPEVDAIVERCAAQRALFFQHTWAKTTGNLPGESSPNDLAELARRHPGVPLVCGHTGGNWTLGIRTVRSLPNVSVDLAGSDPTNGFVEMAVRELGADRVLWGSDAGGRSWASQLGKVMGADLPEEDKFKILGGNLKRLLTPILTAKNLL
ncbi:MAG: amidohydrolase [Bryobacterales bacterium]|nr:amidohydrolase [Bryobacterales bacterium]